MPLVGILASERGRAFEKNRVTTEKDDVMTNREGACPAPDRVGFPHHGHAGLFGSVVAFCFRLGSRPCVFGCVGGLWLSGACPPLLLCSCSGFWVVLLVCKKEARYAKHTGLSRRLFYFEVAHKRISSLGKR